MVTDITYELIRIGKDLENVSDDVVEAADRDIDNIIKEMVESDKQYQFKCGIFRRQYNSEVSYYSFGMLEIFSREQNQKFHVFISDFLETLSFKLWNEMQELILEDEGEHKYE